MSAVSMTEWTEEVSPRFKARMAGLLYLIVGVAGGFAEIFSIVMTAERDTSLPVPDVVATAIYGGRLDEMRSPPSSRSS